MITLTVAIYNIVQSKVNRGLANQGVIHTNVDMNESFATQSKLRTNSPLQGGGENNLLPSQTIIIIRAVRQQLMQWTGQINSLPLRTIQMVKNICQNSARMKGYFYHEQNHFIDYSDDLVPDDSVIYVSNGPFKYNEREGSYNEFIGNPKVQLL